MTAPSADERDDRNEGANVPHASRRGRSQDATDELQEWIRRLAQHRDAAAYNKLFGRFAPIVKSYMIRSGADGATAEELAQETLARVWLKAEMYRPDIGNPTSWVLSIARNLRIDRFRKERVWVLTQELPADHEEEPSDQASAEERLSDSRRDAHVREALSSLPDDQREVIVMSFIGGLSHSEIAQRLELPIGTVKSRMRLAYDRLRPILQGHA